jgi:drug/metabolite transporter (DMT)-like permease
MRYERRIKPLSCCTTCAAGAVLERLTASHTKLWILPTVALLTKSSLRLHGWKDLLVLAISGAILAVHWFTFFLSIQVSTVAIGLLAFSTFPLFATFLEPIIFSERLHRRDVITALFVTIGLVLVTPSFDFGNHLTQGLLWGILSAFLYAVLSLLSRF